VAAQVPVKTTLSAQAVLAVAAQVRLIKIPATPELMVLAVAGAVVRAVAQVETVTVAQVVAGQWFSATSLPHNCLQVAQ
jgi:hypothetical protein